MEEQANNSKMWAWIVVGVIVVAVIVYLGVTGGFDFGPTTDPETVNEQQGLSEETGTSPVSEEGLVLQQNSDEPARNDVEPMSPEAPQQSNPISEDDVPASAVRVTMTRDGGLTPSSFTVNGGSAVTLSITSGDAFTHIFAFRDTELQAVAVGVGPGETRAITFNAPTASGEYEFYCNVPGHAQETGVMIVQ